MTPAAFRRRLRSWQKRMLLSDWKVTVEFGPLDHNEKADCDAKPEYREAHLRFDHRAIPDSEVDAYCVHELFHVWTWRLEKAAENWAGDDEALYESVRDIAEDVVTNLERVLLNAARKR